jgi:phosphoribosylformylglycinamidine synthase
MGEDLGAEVHLERVPLKYRGLSYTEIWISEAQERMVLAVPPEHERKILDLFAGEDVEATVIGRYTGDRKLRLFYDGHQVADLEMEFLHDGLPRLRRRAEWRPPAHPEPDIPPAADYGPAVKRILAHPNVASKEWIVRQYDHEVQGGTFVKPLVGAADDGPGDAAVLAPLYGSKLAVILAVGMNPRLSDIDPYVMAAHAVDEACRQVIAVGGSLERTALLDNFAWGNTNKPDRLGGLVRAARGAADVALAYGTPFISGKDSLNNEYDTPEGTVVIPGCLLISAISVMDDVTRAVTMDAKAPGNDLYLIGPARSEMGGSIYYALHDAVGSTAPPLDPEAGRRTLEAVSRAAAERAVRALHDLSEGGLAVAAAEMAFAGGLGIEIELAQVPDGPADVSLFNEGPSRFLAEVRPEDGPAFEAALGDAPWTKVGRVTEEGRLVVKDRTGLVIVDEDVADLKEAWQSTLRF